MNKDLQRDKEDFICAGIQPHYLPETSNNTEQIIGKLNTKYGEIYFSKGRRYWIVNCHLPLNIAEDIFSHPEGKRSVRVAGHCIIQEPKDWVVYYNKKGKELGRLSELNELSEGLKN